MANEIGEERLRNWKTKKEIATRKLWMKKKKKKKREMIFSPLEESHHGWSLTNDREVKKSVASTCKGPPPVFHFILSTKISF